MDISSLNLDKGDWLVINCGNYPSENKCGLVLLAPARQREDLLDAAVDHAIKCHAHEKSEDLRNSINELCEVMTIS